MYSQYISTGNTVNKLKVICRKSTIELYANGHLLKILNAKLSNDTGSNGIGIIYGYNNKGTNISWDNIKMWAVE
jgi:hypothetical protein